MTMINRLTSPDLAERAAIVDEIIEDIEKENSEGAEGLTISKALALGDIQVGRPVQLTSSQKFIENTANENTVELAAVCEFFRQPPKAKTSKRGKRLSKKGSREKSIKNSREKSENAPSVVSGASEHRRKVSKGKGTSSNVSSHTGKRQVGDSPARRPSKSKSTSKQK